MRVSPFTHFIISEPRREENRTEKQCSRENLTDFHITYYLVQDKKIFPKQTFDLLPRNSAWRSKKNAYGIVLRTYWNIFTTAFPRVMPGFSQNLAKVRTALEMPGCVVVDVHIYIYVPPLLLGGRSS